jgi:hypothetical protein
MDPPGCHNSMNNHYPNHDHTSNNNPNNYNDDNTNTDPPTITATTISDPYRDANGTINNNRNSNESFPMIDEEILEQYRLMAIIEANVRVQDNTGFDRMEYDRQQREASHRNIRPRSIHFFLNADPKSPYSWKPHAILPEPSPLRGMPLQMSTMNALTSSASSSSTITATTTYPLSSLLSTSITGTAAAAAALGNTNQHRTNGNYRPEEPSLPPRRANRRYNEHPRTTLSELCDGVVVQQQQQQQRLISGTVDRPPIWEDREQLELQAQGVISEDVSQLDNTDEPRNQTPTMASQESNNQHPLLPPSPSPPLPYIIVKCLGCGCLLQVHRLAGLVNCSKCLTVSPTLLLPPPT